jgi:hypothetical protein
MYEKLVGIPHGKWPLECQVDKILITWFNPDLYSVLFVIISYVLQQEVRKEY